MWGTPVGDQFEISEREGRRIVHGREHHPFANGIQLQIQAADVAAVERHDCGGALMALNGDSSGRDGPSDRTAGDVVCEGVIAAVPNVPDPCSLRGARPG